MYYAIQVTLSNIQMQFGSSTQNWMGLLIVLDVLIGVKGYIGEEVCMTFDVQDDGRLTFTHKETNLFSFCLQKDVRVIANNGSTIPKPCFPILAIS